MNRSTINMRESTNVNSMLTRFKEKEEILQKKKEEQKNGFDSQNAKK